VPVSARPRLPPTVAPSDPEALPNDCSCLDLDERALEHALDDELGEPGLSRRVRERCPHLFSARPVFVAPGHQARVSAVVGAIESVVALPAWREEALAAAPPIARFDPHGPRGVCFGYDFHLAGDRLSLIEVNTNAGGAMLNAALARAQRACCAAFEPWLPGRERIAALEAGIVAMFQAEWAAAGHSRGLASVAIVDEAPAGQYLYPEFLLFARLFERHGIRAVIADPAALCWQAGRLLHDGQPIDLVYNRLTDFHFEAPSGAALRAAYLARAAVVTPHPRAHALYADKRLMAIWSDADRLAALGVPPATRDLLLAHVPRTERVDAAAAARLWAARRTLFFKPAGGYGGRAAYRGDKLTRRVWDEIVAAGDYVAQVFVAPGRRLVDAGGAALQPMKFDLRAYVYAGRVQWLAARVYQGQTTNFRTPGGGFAAVCGSRLAGLAGAREAGAVPCSPVH